VRRFDQALARLRRFPEAIDRLPWMLVLPLAVITAMAVGVLRGDSVETAASNALAALLIVAVAATPKWVFSIVGRPRRTRH
jgi:hypothetical protein